MLALAILLAAPALPLQGPLADPDSDGDGLSDFQEVHKYGTDPAAADSDGDGIPDGEWDERREYAYSVRAVLHVMAPFDVATMADDWQDVRVLEEHPDLLECEVVVYPFATVAETIEPDARWRETASPLARHVRPRTCSDWDEALREELTAELAERGVALDALDDVRTAEGVAGWLLERSATEDSFTTFALTFADDAPRVAAGQEERVQRGLERAGRTLQQQLDHELFGKAMFVNRVHGTCTSTAIYLQTGLRAAGLPTRTIVCVPVVDASDAREVAWIASRIEHVGVRARLLEAAERLRRSWASHTLNEVYVGGRWRRLDGARLGSGPLDGSLGLLVRVHTFDDHAQSGLAAWGDREHHPLHEALFGGPNPYSCVSLSDRFGAHASVPNEPPGLRSLTIRSLGWYDAPDRPARLKTSLEPPEDRYVVARFDTTGVDGHEALLFYLAVDKDFVLRASGHPDVPARGIQKFWGDSGDFLLRIETADLGRLARGVSYELVWTGAGPLRWTVEPGARIAR